MENNEVPISEITPSIQTATQNTEINPLPSPEQEAQKYVELLNKVSALPPDQSPDLDTAKQVSDSYRRLSGPAWDLAFPNPITPESIETYENRMAAFNRSEKTCSDHIRQREIDAVKKAEAETAELHHKLSDAVLKIQQTFFPENPTLDPDSGVSRQSVTTKSGQVIEQISSPNQQFKAVLSPDFVSDEKPRKLFTIKDENSSYTVGYSDSKENNVLEDMVLSEDLKDTDGKTVTNTIFTNSSGSLFLVDINDQPQARDPAIKTTEAVIDRLGKITPPTLTELAANTTKEQAVDDLLKIAGIT